MVLLWNATAGVDSYRSAHSTRRSADHRFWNSILWRRKTSIFGKSCTSGAPPNILFTHTWPIKSDFTWAHLSQSTHESVLKMALRPSHISLLTVILRPVLRNVDFIVAGRLAPCLEKRIMTCTGPLNGVLSWKPLRGAHPRLWYWMNTVFLMDTR